MSGKLARSVAYMLLPIISKIFFFSVVLLFGFVSGLKGVFLVFNWS
jgi:hypothetical protein